MSPSSTPLVLFGIPTYGSIPAAFAVAKGRISVPLGAATAEYWMTDNSLNIAEKRNAIARAALDQGARYVLFLGDDTLPPPHVFTQLLTTARNRNASIVTGLYVSRSNPPQPMIWRGYMEGSYYDWHVGDVFPVDWAGCDCMLVDTRVFRTLPEPWFSQDYVFGPDQSRPIALATEDIYFYEKARAHGFIPWCDTSVQCIHQDRESGVNYMLPADWPQATPGSELAAPGSIPDYLVADLGAGTSSPYTSGTLVRFDIDESLHPDVRCDLHNIPEPDQKYNEVWARHVLEHFPSHESPALIREWSRILKIGGRLTINVPNVLAAFEAILSAELHDRPVGEYPWWQVYGAHDDPWDVHHTGFTPRILRNLVLWAWGDTPIHGINLLDQPDDGQGCFDPQSIDVHTEAGGLNLVLTAIKIRHPKPAIIGPQGRNSHLYTTAPSGAGMSEPTSIVNDGRVQVYARHEPSVSLGNPTPAPHNHTAKEVPLP